MNTDNSLHVLGERENLLVSKYVWNSHQKAPKCIHPLCLKKKMFSDRCQLF